MKTLLIVEDEKLIRQGIKTMVQRSGVPVDIILECNNGEAALELLKDQEIDAMFTDIRMPKMDGIELVRHVHEEIEHPPIIVAISGYDDFSYAVEMLRNGVREYLLKPVEREKIVSILTTINQELSEREEHYIKERKLGIGQLRHVVTDADMPLEELSLLVQKYEASFFPDNYAICFLEPDLAIEERENIFHLPDLEDGQAVIIEEENLSAFLKNDVEGECIGISSLHKGILELRTAYRESLMARKKAFCKGAGCQVNYETIVAEQPVFAELRANAMKFLDENARMQRMQRIGTDRTDELTGMWERFFTTAKKGHITPDEFLTEIKQFLTEAINFYRNSLTDDDIKTLHQLSHVLSFSSIDTYEEAFSDWLLSFHERINEKDDEEKNSAKMDKALEYIQANFKNDLNMAVVSNEISMNYTMFSYCFKQYTGKNFSAYLKEVRMEEAKRLLADSEMKVVDISWEVGYENEKTFMKVFKTVCGVSPSEYRKNVLR